MRERARERERERERAVSRQLLNVRKIVAPSGVEVQIQKHKAVPQVFKIPLRNITL